MRKLIVLTFVPLDGVMQAPGGPEEDNGGCFKYGGWTVGYWDDFMGEVMGTQMAEPFDLLLGQIKPVIDRRYMLSEVPEAIRYVEKGHAKGKVVITLEHNLRETD